MADPINEDTINALDKPKKELLQSPFLENIANKIDDEDLKKIGRIVVEDYKADLGSRTEWDARVKEWEKLFTSTTEKKTYPWNDASNVSLPVLKTACIQFSSRAYEALLPPKEIAKCFPTDGVDIDKAKRCEKYLNWQLNEQMDEWLEDMDVLFLLEPKVGSVVKKTYYDPILKRPVSKTLRVDEFVAPYGVTRLEDAPRKTHRYKMHLNDIRKKGKGGVWINTDDIGKTNPGDETDQPAADSKEVSDKATGLEKSSEQRDNPRIILEQHRTWDMDGDGIEEDYVITVDKESEKVLRIESLTYIDPTTGTEKVFDYFTAYNFIPNADSWMGFGLGHLLEHLNHAINSLTNQLIDAGTLENTKGGWYNRRSNLKGGDLSFDMGQFKAVDFATDDMRKAIFPLEFKPPSQVLFTLLSMLQDYAQDLSSVSEAMLGKIPPSDTTATTMLAVMEQGLKVFSTIHKRSYRSLRKEFRKIMLLNSLYLDEEVYIMVQDSTSSEIQSMRSGRADFTDTIDVIPVADPTITSRAEKLIRAKQAYELGLQNPLVSQDQEAIYGLTKNLYEALEVQNIDEILKKPEPPPEPPDLRPEEEEAEFLQERDVQPLPQQDHESHLVSHDAFLNSEWGAQLTPQGKKLIDGHIRETMALLYLQQKEMIAQQGALNELIGGATQGMGGQPDYAGIPGDFGAEEGINEPGLGAEV